MALMEMQNGQPVPMPKFTSDTPMASRKTTIRGGPESITPITSSPASHGSSSYGKTL